MVSNPKRLSKFVVAIGGFMIMAGMVLTGVFALAIFGVFDIFTLVNTKYLVVFSTALLVTGVLDLIAGIILSRG